MSAFVYEIFWQSYDSVNLGSVWSMWPWVLTIAAGLRSMRLFGGISVGSTMTDSPSAEVMMYELNGYAVDPDTV